MIAKPTRIFCLLSLLVLVPCLHAPEVRAQAADAGQHRADKVTMNMRDADIRALIQWVADKTHKNMIVHKAVQGKVTVLSSQPISIEEAYKVFLSVLQVHGYAAIETDDAVKIVPQALATSSGLPASGTGADNDMVVSVLKLHNASAVKISTMVKPMLSKEALVSPYADTNVLVVADHAANIASVKQLVAQLDSTGDNRIQLVRLKYANASDVLDSLTALMPQSGRGGDSPELSMSVDERSNSILLAGDPARRSRMIKLIKQLDTPLKGEGNTQVVYLHYVDAKELVPILQGLAKSIQADQKDTNKANSVSVESSATANALIINAPPAMLSTMKRVVSQLDIRRAQVLVEALVVEVSGDIANDLGVTWITDPEQSVIAGVSTPGDLPLVSTDTTTTSVLPFAPGKGLTFGYFNSGDLQAAVRALDATQNANILSTPTVVAIDNEEASLLVGQNVPFITGQATGSSSSTTNPFTTIERQDIGITLDVTPRINEGDSVTLEIKQKTENLATSVDTSAVASDIITNKREINTKAMIKDNQILVLGGLISDEQREVKEKVPFLGSLPLIGRLFSSTSKTTSKKNLMVFIHPVILKDEEHMRAVTQKRYNFMKNLREQAGNKQWSAETSKSAAMQEFDTYTPATGTASDNGRKN